MADHSKDVNPESSPPYDYKSYAWRRHLCKLGMRIAFPILAPIHSIKGLEYIPSTGPVLLCYNHINLIDPILILHVLKREAVPLAKIEVMSYPVVGVFPRLYGAITVRRGEVDRRALKHSIDVLQQNEMLVVAPEGTRSDALIKGKAGTAFLAFNAGSPPIVPIGIDNTIGYPTFPFSRRWRQPRADIAFGKPFRFRMGASRPSKEEMERMTDEMMYTIAALLPPHRRGVYADLTKATQDTLEWL